MRPQPVALKKIFDAFQNSTDSQRTYREIIFLLHNAECLVKVCDFGLCRTVSDIAKGEEEYTNLTDYVATRWYRAPEILLASKKYKESVDMWSLGCIFAEMMNGKPIFPGTSTLNQLERVIEKIGFPSEAERKSIETQYS